MGWTGQTGSPGDNYVSESGVGAGAAKVDYTVKHPTSTMNTMYPYNKTFQTESGHLMEYDDTPSAERLRQFHKSGTYNEQSFQGSHVQMTAGHHYGYHKGGHTKTVDQNHDEKHGGHHREVKTGDHHSEHNGDKYETVMGDHISAVKGSHCQMVGGNHYHKVYGSKTYDADTDTNYNSGKNTTFKQTDSLIHSTASHTTNCGTTYTLNAPTSITDTTQGDNTENCRNFIINGNLIVNGDTSLNGALTVTGFATFLGGASVGIA